MCLWLGGGGGGEGCWARRAATDGLTRVSEISKFSRLVVKNAKYHYPEDGG